MDLITGEPYERNFEAGTLPEATQIGSRADAAETTVVSVLDENAVQVIDPTTNETRTVARPTYFDTDAVTVEVFRTATDLYVLPSQ